MRSFHPKHRKSKRRARQPKRVAPMDPPPSPTASTASTLSCSSAFFGEDDHSDFGGLGISFAGGGWLMCYLFGVAKSLRRHSLHHTARFTGTSAGALAAIGLTLDADFDAINDTVLKSYVPQAHGSFTGPFQMRRYLVDALTRHANLEAYDKCNADPLKCTVVYTSLSALAPRRKSTFTSASHLLETLIASCCATPLVGLPFKFENEWVIDGGLTENQPLFQSYHHVSRVVNVSPNVLDTSADIRPSQYVPPWWSMYPPSADELAWVYALGQKDGHDCSGPKLQSPRVAKSEIAQIVGFEWAERFLHFVSRCLVPTQHEPTAHGLLHVELTLRKWLAAVVAVADRVMLLWAALTATALGAILSIDSTPLTSLLALTCVHILIVVSLSRLRLAVHQINASPQWRDVEVSLRAVESHAAVDWHSLAQCQHRLAPHHHTTLATHSALYRLSTHFGGASEDICMCRL